MYNLNDAIEYAKKLKKDGFTKEAICQCLFFKYPFDFKVDETNSGLLIRANIIGWYYAPIGTI